MAEGKRPGGLTALAVLNFVFGGLGALGLLVMFAALSIVGAAGEAVEAESGTNPWAEASLGMLWVILLLSLASTVLMIVAGVGYLGQKRFLGRTLGNGYAITSLAGTAIGLTIAPFGFGTIIGLIYPVLTLALINGTFKDDLVN